MDSEQYTISDVAEKAGVSVSTVSRVLNGKQDVASKTRERVLQVIEELGYTPQAQAQRLRAGVGRNIALLFPMKYAAKTFFNPLDTDFILGAAAAAGEREFFFSLLTNSITKKGMLDLYRSTQVDGLVLMQIHQEDWRVNLLRQANYPFVMIGRNQDTSGLSYVDVDFEASVEMAFDHLVGLGHHKIGFVCHSQDLRESGYGPAVRSWQGYHNVLKKHQLEALYREVSYVGNDVFHMTRRLLEEHPSITGLVTTHSDAAHHILRALSACGRHVPQDCSFVALTSARIAETTIPSLTYVHFPSHEMGYRAADILTRTLTGDLNQPEQNLITPQLVIHHSTQALS